MGFKSWMTPPDFIRELDKDFHFTLDAAASHHNALFTTYCTEDGTYVKNKLGYLKIGTTDGLDTPWAGQTVFCNPPYDANLFWWVDKWQQETKVKASVLLLPPSIDTEWYHSLVRYSHVGKIGLSQGGRTWNGFGDREHTIAFMRGRLKFFHPALMPGTQLKDEVFDYSKPAVPGPSPRAGNLIAIYRRPS